MGRRCLHISWTEVGKTRTVLPVRGTRKTDIPVVGVTGADVLASTRPSGWAARSTRTAACAVARSCTRVCESCGRKITPWDPSAIILSRASSSQPMGGSTTEVCSGPQRTLQGSRGATRRERRTSAALNQSTTGCATESAASDRPCAARSGYGCQLVTADGPSLELPGTKGGSDGRSG